MSMGYVNANAKLDADLLSGTPHLMLHTGDPGNAGADNEARLGTADIVRKPVTMGTAVASTTATEQIAKNTAAVTWAGTEISSGQSITHFSVWNATAAGSVKYIATIQTAKTTGSDGVTVAISGAEVAITVYKTG